MWQASVAGDTVTVTWEAASDDVGVTGTGSTGRCPAFVPGGSTLVDPGGGSTVRRASVTVGTWYYKVRAVDAEGNVSAASDPAAEAVVEEPPAPAQPLELALVGDMGMGLAGHQTEAVLTSMRAQAPDAAFVVGDLSYAGPDSEQAWCDYVGEHLGTSIPVGLLAGNHESDDTLDGFIDDYIACMDNPVPGPVSGTYGRQFYVDLPAGDPNPLVRLVMISPGITYPGGPISYAPGSAGRSWTENAVSGAEAAGIPWTIVGTHMNCLGLRDDANYECPMGEGVLNWLLDQDVDLIVNGHEHFYARTHQLEASGACDTLVPGTFNAACVADASNDYTVGAGTVLATVGTGGINARFANPADSDVPYYASYGAQTGQTGLHGYLEVTLTPDELSGRFVSAVGSNNDAFSIGS